MSLAHNSASTAALIKSHQPEQSVYCFSPKALQQQVSRYQAAFEGTLGYAVKSNPDARIIRTLGALGVTSFDVASINEVKDVRRAVPNARLLYDNPIKSQLEISTAYKELDVRVFALDDMIELEKIDRITQGDSNVVMVVRFKIDDAEAVYDLSTKFGCNSDVAVELLQRADQLGYKTALTFHVGSQCTRANSYTNYVAEAASIVAKAGVDISMLNVGGGFPSPYLDAELPKLHRYFDEVNSAWQHYFANTNAELVCEPGRGLVDTCVTLLTKVKHRREQPVVYLNDGVYGGFMEQVFSPIELPVRHYRADGTAVHEQATAAFTVFGPTCDSIDKLYYQPQLHQSIAEGDYLEWGLMGGYGSSTATKFNGFESNLYVTVDEAFDYPAAVQSMLTDNAETA